LAVSLQNNWSGQWGYNFALEGAFIDFRDRKNNSLEDGNKQLLLQLNGAVRYWFTAPGHLLQPYVQAGGGVSKFSNYYGAFLSTGAGVQLNITDQFFVLFNGGYRVPLTSNQHRHVVFSIGLAGPLGRKKVIKKQPALWVVTPIPAPKDSDGDGLTDETDSCPSVAGTARNHGCPEPEQPKVLPRQEVIQPVEIKKEPGEDVRRQVSMAAQQVFFKTGSFVLLPTSYPALEKVASILKNDPALHLVIEGHTDNTGTKTSNQLLSENRAKAVLQYLEKQGVNAGRLSSAGYGDQQPIAGNSSIRGRALNRRVEMKLFY
jgi:OOP family OmpA-OmpF porin